MNQQTPVRTTSAETAHLGYRADIDGLRAVAVLSVVAFHAFPEWLSGGFIGVDLFFVISGFLISTIIFDDLRRGKFSFLEFYSRRVRRIFPALFVVMLVCFAIGWVALLPNEFAQLGKNIAGGAGFISNFMLWGEAGYFDNAADLKPLLHLWSLGIEEQFYIVFPFLAWCTWRRNWSLLVTTAILGGLSFALNLYVIDKDAIATFYAPLTRMWELLCGGCLAGFARKHRTASAASKSFSDVLSFAGLALLAIGLLSIPKDGFPGLWATVPVFGAALVIFAGPGAWLNRQVLSNRVLVWFGLISFPLYLWHWPLLSFLRIVENGPVSFEVRFLAVILAVVLSWATYRFVERPARFGAKWKNLKTVALLVLMCAIGLIGLFTYTNGGFGDRLEGPKRALNELISTPYPDVPHVDCQSVLTELDASSFDDCLLSIAEPPTLLFLGDSHTKQFRSTDWGAFGKESVLMITKSECLPFSNEHFMGQGNCRRAFEDVLGYITASPSLTTVVLSSHWAYLMSGSFEQRGSNWRIASPPDRQDIATFSERFDQFATSVLEAGKKVVFVRDIPDLDFDIATCFDNRPLRVTPAKMRSDCSIDQRAFEERLATSDAAVDDILARYPAISVFDPRALFCNGMKCKASNGTLPYYTNGDHLNHLGASMVLDCLMERVIRPR